jgi:hypothetical protein
MNTQKITDIWKPVIAALSTSSKKRLLVVYHPEPIKERDCLYVYFLKPSIAVFAQIKEIYMFAPKLFASL